MHKLLIFFVICFVLNVIVQAQTAIYVCPNTGAWAAKWEDGTPPYAPLQQVKDEAYLECKRVGGTDCQFFYSGNCRGCWWAFIIGNDGYTINYLAVWHDGSKLEAEQKARDDYKKGGGVAYSTAKVTSWYVP